MTNDFWRRMAWAAAMAAVWAARAGLAEATLSTPGSTAAIEQFVGMSGLSGENQGAAMDGAGRVSPATLDDPGNTAGDNICYSEFTNDQAQDQAACVYGYDNGQLANCFWGFPSYDETSACQWGQNQRQADDSVLPPPPPPPPGGGGGGAVDPLLGLMAVAFGALSWAARMRRSKAAALVAVAAVCAGRAGLAQAALTTPSSTAGIEQFVGMSGLSGENQGAAMDGAGRVSPATLDDPGNTAGDNICYSEFTNDQAQDQAACVYGYDNGQLANCFWGFPRYDETSACQWGQNQRAADDSVVPPPPPPPPGGGGGGALDPLWSLMTAAFGVLSWAGRMRRSKAAALVAAAAVCAAAGAGPAKAELARPSSTPAIDQFVGIARASGENQGAAMDGGRSAGVGTLDISGACDLYSGDDWDACNHGAFFGDCMGYDGDQWFACQSGQSEYDQNQNGGGGNNGGGGGGGGGGAVDPALGLLVLTTAAAAAVGRRRI